MVAVAIVTVIVMALVMLSVAGFQSLKDDIATSEARQKKAIVASETQAMARPKELNHNTADLRAENRALSGKLDQMLECC